MATIKINWFSKTGNRILNAKPPLRIRTPKGEIVVTAEGRVEFPTEARCLLNVPQSSRCSAIMACEFTTSALRLNTATSTYLEAWLEGGELGILVNWSS